MAASFSSGRGVALISDSVLAFKVKFSSDNGNSTLNVVTDEIAALGDLMKETKRLADVAGESHRRRSWGWTSDQMIHPL